ncbi:MAG TPA: hypothetical protein VMA72_01940 [Streptosporangiaceae bacterium]|nr:hypothetical protein [Streptosporangiaceae bacterium]
MVRLSAAGLRHVRLARRQRGAGFDQPLHRQIQPGRSVADLTGELLVPRVFGGCGTEFRQASGQPLHTLLGLAR